MQIIAIGLVSRKVRGKNGNPLSNRGNWLQSYSVDHSWQLRKSYASGKVRHIYRNWTTLCGRTHDRTNEDPPQWVGSWNLRIMPGGVGKLTIRNASIIPPPPMFSSKAFAYACLPTSNQTVTAWRQRDCSRSVQDNAKCHGCASTTCIRSGGTSI